MSTDYLKKILTARVYDVAKQTDLEPAVQLSKKIGAHVLLKREDQQDVFSFKIRGAYNKMSALSSRELKRGVIAASAGNHAQGVALSAQALKCMATIVMPTTTPAIKIEAVKSRGATVVLYGLSYSDSYDHALKLAEAKNLTFIHPYDDPEVIAGQGTIGFEILRQYQKPITAIFIAIGGGGLIAGVGAYVKALYPEIKIIGVEPVDSAAMSQSLAAGRRVRLPHVGIFADGVAVKQVGKETFRVCRDVVDKIVLVDGDEICAAVKDVYDNTRTILEPAGALAIAGMKKFHAEEKPTFRTKETLPTYVAIACGANMNFSRLRHISERAIIGEKKEALFAVTIPEVPGSFKQFCNLIGNRSITEFNYRYNCDARAHIYVGIEVESQRETETILRLLRRKKIDCLNLTDNETAKLHVRHLVGGKATYVENELLYRFQFPEHPGALMTFLEAMSPDWNISLFHYRNHGADFGRALMGIQVPMGERKKFKEFLKQLNYQYFEETDNPACALFLR